MKIGFSTCAYDVQKEPAESVRLIVVNFVHRVAGAFQPLPLALWPMVGLTLARGWPHVALCGPVAHGWPHGCPVALRGPVAGPCVFTVTIFFLL